MYPKLASAIEIIEIDTDNEQDSDGSSYQYGEIEHPDDHIGQFHCVFSIFYFSLFCLLYTGVPFVCLLYLVSLCFALYTIVL